MKGGLHPDHIRTLFQDVTPGADDAAFKTYTGILTTAPIHIIGGTISYFAKFPDSGDMIPEAFASTTEEEYYQSLPLNVTLFNAGYTHDHRDRGGFNIPGNTGTGDRTDDRTHIVTAALNPHTPTFILPEHLWGYFSDGGLYFEVQGAQGQNAGARICIQYVERPNFIPAYSDPLVNARGQWKCVNGDTDFLDGFYGGTQSNPGDLTGETTTPGTNTGDPGDDTSWDITTVGTVPTIPETWTFKN